MPMGKNSRLLQVTISKETMERMDAEAEKLGLTRAGLANLCIATYFRQNEAFEILQRLSESGFLDEWKKSQQGGGGSIG